MRLAFLIVVLAALGEVANAASLELIHADASEGVSSGGHSALRVDDRVYHFQVHDGRVLRLVRQSWPGFLTLYSSLENRNLDLASIEVPERTRDRVRDRFERVRIVQKAQFARLELARFEHEWARASRAALRANRATARIRLPGAGLFEEPDPSETKVGPEHTAARRLKAAVVREWGADFFARAEAALEVELVGEWAASAALTDLDWVIDRIPPHVPSEAERLRESMWQRESLAALQLERPLRDDRLLDPIGSPTRPLTDDERRFLTNAARELEARVVRLAGSRRPDRGRALLIAIARHRAVARSLADDRFWTLDPFPPDAPRIESDNGASRLEATRELAAINRARHRALRRQLVARIAAQGAASASWDLERSLSNLEVAAARDFDFDRALREGAPLRRAEAPHLPLPEGIVEVPILPASVHATARHNEARIQRELRDLYGYSLVGRNCATELVRTLRDAFPDRAALRIALGGELDPDGISFFPLALHHEILGDLRVDRSWRLPSHRARRLEAMRREENDLVVWLREGNTLSSQIYLDNPRDGSFLLFSDDQPWLRPILGTVNLAYATLQGGLGLLSWPFDGGQRLKRGLTGAVFSLPELGFVNIRKGRFDFNQEIRDRLAIAEPEPPTNCPDPGLDRCGNHP